MEISRKGRQGLRGKGCLFGWCTVAGSWELVRSVCLSVCLSWRRFLVILDDT